MDLLTGRDSGLVLDLDECEDSITALFGCKISKLRQFFKGPGEVK